MSALPLLLIFGANVIGGLTYPWQKMALEGLPPATVVLLRNLVALACMAAWRAARTNRPAPAWTPGERRRLAAVGILGYGLPLLLGIVGVKWSTAANGSILILLEPASILFLSWLLLREPVSRRQTAGLLVGLAGALIVVLEGASLAGLADSRHLLGNLVLAVHGVLWGCYSPLMKPLAAKYGPIALTEAAMRAALLLLLPAALLEAPQWTAGPALAPALLRTLELGLLGSFAATVMWTWSLRSLAASAVAPFVFLQPLAGGLAGHLWLGERLTGSALLGAALIGGSVLLVAFPRRKRVPVG